MRSAGEERTRELAARLAAGVGPGTVILLDGPMGSGKTTFAQGFLRGLGHRGPVPSPTFVLVKEYRRVSPPVYHMDLYRLGEEGVSDPGVEECLGDPEAVSLVEWPETVRAAVPPDHLEVSLDHVREGVRSLCARATGPRSRAVLRSWKP